MKQTEQTLGLAVRESQLPAIAAPQSITIEQAFNAAATKALDKDSLEVMKQLLAMDAERKFNSAFVVLQSQIPIIEATSVIPNRGKYAKFEHIMEKIAKPMAENGFSVAFNQEVIENRIVVTCKLMHIGGHSASNAFAVRSGGKADSDTQADCKASTTAKRNALMQCLNIVITQDCLADENSDASLEGNPNAFVTPEQADELRRRVGDLGDAVDMRAFWQFAQATKFMDIPARRYAEIDLLLRRKEQAGK